MSATLMLDPNYINLHALLHRYFTGSYAVFAEVLNLPAKKAETVCQDSIDIVLVSLISEAQAESSFGGLPTTPSPVAFVASTLSTYPTLPLTQILGKNLDMAIHHLMEKYTLTKAVAEKTLSLLGTLCVYYVDRLSKDGRLSDEQQRLWLGLQTVFLPKKTQAIVKAMKLVLTPPHLKTDNDSKKDKLKFEQKRIKIPNWRWLVTLALTIQREEPLELVRDGRIDFTPQFDYSPAPTAKPEFDGVRYAWFGVGALMVAVVGILAVKVFSPSAPVVQETAVKTTQKPVIQDVAIVRVDDKADKKLDNPPKSDNASTSSQTASTQKSATDNSANKVEMDTAGAKTTAENTVNDKAVVAKTDQAKTNKTTTNQQTNKATTDKATTTVADKVTAKKDEPTKTDTRADTKSTDKSSKTTDKSVDKTVVKAQETTKSTQKDTQATSNQPAKPVGLSREGATNYTLGDFLNK